MAAGPIADYLGKKRGLALCALCFGLSSLGMLFAANLHQFVLWRLIGGLGIGAASVISPNYIAEIAPTRVRGRCVTLYQLGIVAGILAAVFVNMLIELMGDEAWNITTGWRWMFLAGIVPATLFGLMIFPAVESPRWLMKMGRRDEAVDVLARMNGTDAALREATEIDNTLATEEGHISELFTTFRRPLLLGIMLAGLQQVSGITPIFSFLPEIFRTAGTATSDAFFQSVLVSLVGFPSCLMRGLLRSIPRYSFRLSTMRASTTSQFFRPRSWRRVDLRTGRFVDYLEKLSHTSFINLYER